MNEPHKHRSAILVHGTLAIAFYLGGLAGLAVLLRSLWLCEWWHAAVSLLGALLSTDLGRQFTKHRNLLDADR